MNSGEPAVNCPGCNQATKKTDKAGHGRTMPRFNLITTRPISKKTSPPSVPPSADNSLYRIPFFFEIPTKEKKTKTSLRQFQAPFDFWSNQNHQPYWEGLAVDWWIWELECNLAEQTPAIHPASRLTKNTGNCSTCDTATTPFLPTSAGLMLLLGFFEHMDDLMLPRCNCFIRDIKYRISHAEIHRFIKQIATTNSG